VCVCECVCVCVRVIGGVSVARAAKEAKNLIKTLHK